MIVPCRLPVQSALYRYNHTCTIHTYTCKADMHISWKVTLEGYVRFTSIPIQALALCTMYTYLVLTSSVYADAEVYITRHQCKSVSTGTKQSDSHIWKTLIKSIHNEFHKLHSVHMYHSRLETSKIHVTSSNGIIFECKL